MLVENRGIRDIAGFFSTKEGKTFIKGVKTNIFTVVERSKIQQLLKEQNFSMTDAVDANQAAQVGKLLGVDAIITGSVDYSFTDTPEEFKSKKKNGSVKINYKLTRSVAVSAKMKIISVATGEILGNSDKEYKNSDAKMDEERSGIKSVEALVDECLKPMAGELVTYFSPQFILNKYKLQKIKVKEFKKQAEEAGDFFEKGDLNRAYPVYKAVADADPYNASALYNLGLIYDMVGDFEQSYACLKNAYELEPKEEDYQKAFQRTEKNLEFSKVLTSMGIVPEKYDFKIDETALAAKVMIKGDKSDRIEVFSEPKAGSSVVAKIPGDSEFVVLEKNGGWVKLKLLGGKEGWVQKDKVKE
ncbi:MAG TPA: CsgG/HfaB family protein [bacterium]|nr:CsgG/HfaB family protein [bacterium]